MAKNIMASVGRMGGINRPADVRVVQELLNKVPEASGGPRVKLFVDGACGNGTCDAIQVAPPLLLRAGGSIPVVSALADRDIPAIVTGFGLPEGNMHSPNERLLVEYLPLGVATAHELFTTLAGLRS